MARKDREVDFGKLVGLLTASDVAEGSFFGLDVKGQSLFGPDQTVLLLHLFALLSNFWIVFWTINLKRPQKKTGCWTGKPE